MRETPATIVPDWGDMTYWQLSHKGDKLGCQLADRHYSRRKIGAPQFMPPGQTIVMVAPDLPAVWGWWRPHPASGIKSMNGLDGWTCTIFRNECPEVRSSLLILEAELFLAGYDVGPDGLITYVKDSAVRSKVPGKCFIKAGYTVRGRSKDGKKTLLTKPWELA
jgi:hypothetical protein